VRLIGYLLAIGLAISPFVVILQTAGWVIGQHAFPGGGAWAVAGLGVVFWIVVLTKQPGSTRPAPPPRPQRKRYVMRGYGGGKNATSLHPRQEAMGRRIVHIPGVGFRHVQAKPRRQGP
jgi:hypothetical protein